MLRRSILALVALLAGVGLRVADAEAQTLRPAADPETANVTAEVLYLRDPTGSITLRDMVRPAVQRSLKPYGISKLRTPGSNDATDWFKFDVAAPPDSPVQGVLYFTDSRVSELTAYIQVIGADADILRHGANSSSTDAVVEQPGIGLPIRVDAGQTRAVFVSVRGSNLSGQLEFWNPSALTGHLEGQNSKAFILTVIAGLVLLGAAILAIWKRSLAWVCFAGGMACVAAVILMERGLHPLPRLSLSTDAALLARCGGAAFLVLFLLFLSGLSKRLPALSWFSTLLVAALSATALLLFAAPPQANIVAYLMIGFAAVLILGISTAVISLRPSNDWRWRALAGVCAAVITVCLLPLPMEFIGQLSASNTVQLCLAAMICVLGVFTGPDLVLDRDVRLEELETVTGLSKSINAGAYDMPDGAIDDVSQPDSMEMEEGAFHDVDQADAQEEVFKAAALTVQQHADPAPAQTEPTGGAALDPADYPQTAFDTLTGVFNVQTMEAVGEKLILQVRRYERDVSAIMVQLPDYVDLAETVGQSAADRAIKLLAVTCMRELRESDFLGRISDDTFLGLLPETPINGAQIALDRTCTNLSERTLPTRTGMLRINPLAAACALSGENEGFDDLVIQLAQALTPLDEQTQGQAAE